MTLTIANALGNGIGDDKAIYAYVPAMIEYYLGEKPALEQVPTWICAERAQRDYVLDNLADLVVKPIDGFGGNGVIIGPDASDEALETRRRELLSQPERYIAQETVALSTHPDVRRGRHVPASRRPACLRPPAARTRRFGHGARDAGRPDPGRHPGVADRQFVVRRRQQGHLDTHRRPRPRRRLQEHGRRMCGICGEIRFDGRSADVAAVTRMTCAMESRGPDSDGVVARGPIALGHRRLSIIDLSARGAQPMVDSDLGLTLVFNGCIYNYQELRKELEAAGYRFFSTADSEVVVKGFHHWGTRCVEKFKGMFAFAVADRETGVVTLARDRLGIKPLYLAETPGRLRFASTVRALLDAGDVDTEIDRYALHHYMTFHSVVPAPRTMYKGVRKLPPATVRVIQPDGTHADTLYWSPDFRRDPARGGMVCEGLAGRADGLAAHRGGAAHGRRRAGRGAAVGRHRFVDRGGAAGRAGPARAGHVQHRLRLGGRGVGRRILLLRPDRQDLRHRSPPHPHRLVPAAARCAENHCGHE